MKTSRELETVIASYLAAQEVISLTSENIPEGWTEECNAAKVALFLRPISGIEDVVSKLRVMLGEDGIATGECINDEEIRALQLILAWAKSLLGQSPSAEAPDARPGLIRAITTRLARRGGQA